MTKLLIDGECLFSLVTVVMGDHSFPEGQDDVDRRFAFVNVDRFVKLATNQINRLRKVVDVAEEKVTLAWGSKPYFRQQIWPAYKASRSQNPYYTGAMACFDKLKELFPSLTYPTLEADDVLGVHSGSHILCTRDKDLKSVPGELLHFDELTVQTITEREANLNLWTQTLCGDPSDGYPGCPGWGKVKSAKFLKEWDGKPNSEVWPAVQNLFRLAMGDSEEDPVEVAKSQLRMAYILRSVEDMEDLKTDLKGVPRL